jgi:hypothetical protein
MPLYKRHYAPEERGQNPNLDEHLKNSSYTPGRFHHEWVCCSIRSLCQKQLTWRHATRVPVYPQRDHANCEPPASKRPRVYVLT